MALYGERKAFYDTKTTCFAVVEATTYRSCHARLSLKGRNTKCQTLRKTASTDDKTATMFGTLKINT